MCPRTVFIVHSYSVNLHVMDNSDIQKHNVFDLHKVAKYATTCHSAESLNVFRNGSRSHVKTIWFFDHKTATPAEVKITFV